MMTLDDFVLLGTTVPEAMKDGRVVRCSAGYSVEHGALIRLYPLSPRGGLHRWDRFHVALERNPKDSRRESYKLAGDRHDQDAVDELTWQLQQNGLWQKVPESARLADVERFVVPSIKYLNDHRLSLGIVAPEQLLDWSYEYNREADRAQQQFEGMETPKPESGRAAYPQRPKVRFRDADGEHNLSLNEHGCYEYLRKNPQAPQENLFNNLRWGQAERDVRLLVGNLSHQRNAWVIIAYLGFAHAEPSLFAGAGE
jgi:hypothetical protein